MRVALFGFGEGGARAYELIKAAGHEVVAVYTHSSGDEPHGRAIPRDPGVPYSICIPFHTVGGPLSAEISRQLEADCIISFWFKSKIHPQHLASARLGAWNFHASLLPAYRGRSPINWALVEGARRTGVTVHRMVERLDAGEILLQRGFEVEENDSAPIVYFRCLHTALDLLQEALPLIEKGAPPTRPMWECGKLYPGRRPSDSCLDWGKPARELHNLVRASTAPWPGAYSYTPLMYLWESRVREDVVRVPAGCVVGIDGKALIGTGKGALEVVQWSVLATSPKRPGALLLERVE